MILPFCQSFNTGGILLNALPITEQFEDIAKVDALALEAFPPEEYLSPRTMVQMCKDTGFDFLALYEQANFVGFMTVMTYKELSYLFFLAIDRAQRAKGLGTEAIRLLQALYPHKVQIVDLEMQDARAVNCRQRERRRAFYLRCGYRPTGQYLSYSGVDYEILCMGGAFDFAAFRELMSRIKIKGFSPRYFHK